MTRRKGAEKATTDAGRFLRALFPIVDPTSLVEVRAYFINGKMNREFYDDLDSLEHHAEIVCQVADVYVGVATRRDHTSGKKINLAWANAYFAELDAGPAKPYKNVDKIMAALDAFTPASSIRVLSGAGVHAYWLLDIPVPVQTPFHLAAYEQVTRGLQQRLKADKGTWNADRILRLPGTLWHKKQPPRKVELVQ